MTMNVWFKNNKYYIYYQGRRYERHSFLAAKTLIDSLLSDMVLLNTQNNKAA